MIKFSFRHLLAGCVAVLVLPYGFAQQLEEVFVTAQKRVQALEDVPISITAISGEEIAQSGIDNVDALQDRIPNFRISTAAVSTEIYIRGVGSGANDGFEQSVGVFVDGVFGGRGRQFRAPFLDLERFEVLRGPQGVLLGKNTIAGAVNITTARPTDYFTGYMRGSFTNRLDEGRGTLVASGPFSDSTRGRVAVTARRNNGYLTNSFDNEVEPQLEDFVLRGTLERDFSDSLTARFKYEVGQFDMAGSRFVVSDVGPFQEVFDFYDSNFSQAPYASSKGGLGGEDEFDNTETTNSVLQFDWELPSHTFTSITGYSNFKFRRLLDSDFSPIPLLTTETMPERFEQLSQEIRLLSDPGSRLDYIVGLYWQTNDYDTLRETRVNGDTLSELLTGPLSNAIGAAAVETTGKTFQKFDQSSDSLAAYGQFTWNVSDQFRSTAGVRFSRDKKDARQFIVLRTIDGGINTNELGISLIELFFGFTNHDFSGTRTETDISPSFNVQYDVTDDWMLYGTWARGFKAGGYNAQERSRDRDLFEFDEERATTYEMGAKGKFLDGAARLNVNAYNSIYDDRQVSSFNGVTFVVGNAAKSTSRGVEVDGALALSDDLEIGGSFAYLKSEFDVFLTGPCFAGDIREECVDIASAGVRDLSGETTSYAPKYSGNVYLKGRVDVSDKYELSYGADWSFTDGFFYNVDLDPLDFQESYGLVDLRVALAPKGGHWELALVGENLTEELINGGYGSDIPLLTGSHFSSSIPPRRVTLQGTWRFGD